MKYFNPKQPAYQRLRDIVSEGTSPLIAWVGAGLSTRAGLPTWTKLRADLVQAARRKIETYNKAESKKLQREIQVAEEHDNYWVAFEILRRILEPATFRGDIRRSLNSRKHVSIPDIYVHLWRLGLRGVLNFNLDRLAERAFAKLHDGRKEVVPFNSRDIGSRLHLLNYPKPFVANLHGTQDYERSWVLTKSQLDRLLGSQEYNEFLSNCFLSNTIIFSGITVDDVAIESPLERIGEYSNDLGNHFWITHRTDRATDKWAERRGIQVIRYTLTDGGDHHALDEMFSDLQSYVSTDEAPPPVRPNVDTSRSATTQTPYDKLPAAEILEREEAELIRLLLNDCAKEILDEETESAYAEYEKFCERYDQAIYRAWYVTTSPPKNELLGYKLKEEIGNGAFGTVYRARNDNDEDVAIKILLENIREDKDALQSFRRGVRSMRFLEEQDVKGTISYHEASEIPAFVVMDLVNGPDLKEAVDQRLIDDWEHVLKVTAELSAIIREAHSVPQRVLHRDLRPPNIMLKDFYTKSEDYEVVVLDFDLSWHKGAIEQSVTRETANGYLAPEQLSSQGKTSTRHALVDSFGLGMTCFFMVAHRAPRVSEHRFGDWVETVQNAVMSFGRSEWKSLPARFGRLILSTTREEQHQRWDMSRILGELQRLRAVMTEGLALSGADLIAEEVAARADIGDGYTWDESSQTAQFRFFTGIEMEIRGDEIEREIRLTLGWQESGQQKRKDVRKWVPEAFDQVKATLKSVGFQVGASARTNYDLQVAAVMQVRKVQQKLNAVARGLENCGKILAFE